MRRMLPERKLLWEKEADSRHRLVWEEDEFRFGEI